MRATVVLLIVALFGFAVPGCSFEKMKTAEEKKAGADHGPSVAAEARDKFAKQKEDKAKSDDKALRDEAGAGVDTDIGTKVDLAKKSDPIPTSLPPPVVLAPLPPAIATTKVTEGGTKLTETVKDVAKTDKKESPPAAGVADPVVGREPKKKMPAKDDLRSGILTAGSFDDNTDPFVFSRYVKKMSQHRGLGDLTTKMQGQRLMVFVKDGAGRPVGNARVKLSAGTFGPVELLTRSDGRAVFMLSFDGLPDDKTLQATVSGPNGGRDVTETITAGAARWEVTLPSVQARLPKNLDLCIVIDTTGSMGDELKHLRAEIRGISDAIKKRFPEVRQRFSLVCYRDEGQGDEYVTRPFDFTDSLDTFHKNLSAQSASGGGDYPEAMHKGLESALQLRWNDDSDTARLIFLIADAPPHAQHMNRTLAHANTLRQKGVAIHPIACSGYDDACEFVMRSCALISGSKFLFLTDDSGVGNGHAEPSIPYYQVERLEKLMIRTIASELSGQQVQADNADIIRTVGKKVN